MDAWDEKCGDIGRAHSRGIRGRHGDYQQPKMMAFGCEDVALWRRRLWPTKVEELVLLSIRRVLDADCSESLLDIAYQTSCVTANIIVRLLAILRR